MKIIEILKYVEANENSAFFYTPNIYEDGKSYFFKKPCKILKGRSADEIKEVFHKVDGLLKEDDMVSFATVPYEIGCYFQPKKIRDSYLGEAELKFTFYKKKDVEIFGPDILSFDSVDQYLENLKTSYDLKLDICKKEYIKKINKIKDYIKKGDTYQVNFTTKAKFKFNDNAVSLFLSGIFNQSARYSAFINYGKEYILSFSPELFFSTDYKKIYSKPMKGTVKRSADPEKDRSLAGLLLSDEKNLAENVMIVDLIRNDIGRIARTDSVKVEKLYEIEKYETLYQLTSKISGELRSPEISKIFESLFPSGSITGAPKIRSMQIIGEVENSPRNLYTGAVGLLSEKQALFNIPIRTVSIDKIRREGIIGLGSGIVWDSSAADEYEEVLLKGEFVNAYPRYFELLETMLFEDGDLFLRDYHMKRLRDTAGYFLFKFDHDGLLEKLNLLREELEGNVRYKVRLLLTKWGKVKIESEKIEDDFKEVKVTLNRNKRCDPEKFLYHKTTYRPWDNELKIARENGFDEVLFISEKDELLEGAISNILIEKNGKLFTPPVHLGILNGCYRQYLIDEHLCKEKLLTISDLKNADAVYLCNSVRKMISVKEISG